MRYLPTPHSLLPTPLHIRRFALLTPFDCAQGKPDSPPNAVIPSAARDLLSPSDTRHLTPDIRNLLSPH